MQRDGHAPVWKLHKRTISSRLLPNDARASCPIARKDWRGKRERRIFIRSVGSTAPERVNNAADYCSSCRQLTASPRPVLPLYPPDLRIQLIDSLSLRVGVSVKCKLDRSAAKTFADATPVLPAIKDARCVGPPNASSAGQATTGAKRLESPSEGGNFDDPFV